jgi:hypothetical protein
MLLDAAEWSSLVARWAHNPKVVGSNPASATITDTVIDTIVSITVSFFYAVKPFVNQRLTRHRV